MTAEIYVASDGQLAVFWRELQVSSSWYHDIGALVPIYQTTVFPGLQDTLFSPKNVT
jgi:hypothetical protein